MLKKYALDSEAREWRRLQKDVRFLCELQHPHVAELQYVFESDDPDLGASRRVAYVQLRHYSGGDLSTWLWPLPGTRPPPEPMERIRLLQHLALALQHLHAHGVAHGDVKLANVLVSCEVRERPSLVPPSPRPRGVCSPCARLWRRRASARARCSPTSRRAVSSRRARCRG